MGFFKKNNDNNSKNVKYIYDYGTPLEEYAETVDRHPNWDRQFLFVKYADKCAAFRAVNTSYAEAETYMDDIILAWDSTLEVIDEYSKDEDAEEIGLVDFFAMVVEVVAKNVTTSQGEPFLLEPIGWGTCVIDNLVEEEE